MRRGAGRYVRGVEVRIPALGLRIPDPLLEGFRRTTHFATVTHTQRRVGRNGESSPKLRGGWVGKGGLNGPGATGDTRCHAFQAKLREDDAAHLHDATCAPLSGAATTAVLCVVGC